MSSPRIGIDVRYLSHALVGGVHLYVQRLLPELLGLAPELEFVLYADTKAPLELAPPPNAQVRMLSWRHAASSVWNDRVLARHMARDGVDVAFFPANYGFGPRRGASVVTIHDALNLLPLRTTLFDRGHAKTLRSRAMTVYLHAMTSRAARHATRIVTMSTYSRETIRQVCHRRPEDFTIVHHGAPPRLAVTPADIVRVAAHAGGASRYVLADGLKNPAVILRAAARLDPAVRRSCAFVFFARHANVLPELRLAAAAGEVVLLVRPPNDELAALYAGAAAFIFPSWVEGFGFPLLEAMSYGAPIVASDRGSIPEIAGDAALLVDADDDRALAEALHRVLTDAAEAARLRARGTSRVARFTWRRSAEETLGALRQAHGERPAEGGR
jgi:glycosyltransferase involved in cell wall biosynthesis